jgi:hypothetical protein
MDCSWPFRLFSVQLCRLPSPTVVLDVPLYINDSLVTRSAALLLTSQLGLYPAYPELSQVAQHRDRMSGPWQHLHGYRTDRQLE